MDEQQPAQPTQAEQPTRPERPPTPEERIGALLRRQEEPETPERKPETESEEQPEEVAEAAPEAGAKDGDGEADTITVSSLSELMEQLGADTDSMYDLTVPVTINGKREDVPLSEWKDSYRANKEAQRFQEEAKAAREQAKQYAEQTQTAIKAQLAQANKLAEGLDAMYLKPFERVDWAALRQDDPAEYAAKRQEYIDTKAAVDQQKQSVLAEIEQFKQSAEYESTRVMQERLAQEREALLTKWPEMATDKADAERSALVGFLKSDGFTDDEIGAAADHRMILLARDAMRYREQAKKADVAKKKVIKIGKTVLTPGAAQTKAQQQSNRVQPLRDKLRKTGKIEDAAALLSQTFQGRK